MVRLKRCWRLWELECRLKIRFLPFRIGFHIGSKVEVYRATQVLYRQSDGDTLIRTWAKTVGEFFC